MEEREKDWPILGRHLFSDGERTIDLVLVHYEKREENSNHPLFDSEEEKLSADLRESFFSSLQKSQDLELEEVRIPDTDIVCTFCHLPTKTAYKMADKVKLLLPLSLEVESTELDHYDLTKPIRDFFNKFFGDNLPVEFNDVHRVAFNVRDADKFLNFDDKDKFLTDAERSFLTYRVLEETKFSEGFRTRIGVQRMINKGHFVAAFPLHSGPSEPLDTDNLNSVLYEYWARPMKFWKVQPLEHVRQYFGTGVAFYFLWLGFYTRMLIVLSVLGICSYFFHFFAYFRTSEIDFICDSDLIMCPICQNCDMFLLKDQCLYYSVDSFADNNLTIVLAFVVCIWAFFFCKLWRRTQAYYAYKWNVYDIPEMNDYLRPEYVAVAKKTRVNPVTQEREPYFPDWVKTVRTISAFTFVAIMLLAVLGFFTMCIFYRIFVTAVFNRTSLFQPTILASLTAAILTLIFIIICNFIYDYISLKLTDWEMHRTQEEYNRSLTFKSYIFQFVNFYSSIFYIAFLKGRFSGSPNDHPEVFGARMEQCSGTCMVELTIQLSIIMIGKQIVDSIVELIEPIVWRIWNRTKAGWKKSKNTRNDKWHFIESSVFLAKFSGLFPEYLEMVIQYGFCTIFVIALPLAPFFALINNIVEIRIHARKILCQMRRAVPATVKNIGAWQQIVELITIIAVISNSFLIGFTSDFVPKQVFKRKQGSLDNFVKSNLVEIPIEEDFITESRKWNITVGVDTCFYRHETYTSRQTGSMTPEDFEVLVGRLCVVLLFQQIMLFFKFILDLALSDIPKALSLKLKRRRYLQSKHLKQD